MELQEVKAAAENAMKAFEAMKTEVLPLGKKFEELSDESKTQFTRMEKSISDAIELTQKAEARTKAIEEQNKTLETQYKALEIAFHRAPTGGGSKGDKVEELVALRKKAFNEFARSTGKQDFAEYLQARAAEEPELKALSVGTDPAGGYTVMPELGGMVVTKVFESSPVRMLASVEVHSGGGPDFPVALQEPFAVHQGQGLQVAKVAGIFLQQDRIVGDM